MKEKIIKRENFITTKWAGGETTQLAIYPEDANFSDKDFLWRISSATFTSTESKFSDFSGYQRYILPLEGNLSLYHEGLYDRDLDKFEVDYFGGSWNTSSKNTIDCRDYNFIVKDGKLSKMQILNQEDEYILKNSSIVTMFSIEDFALTLNDKDEKRYIDGFSLFIIELDDKQEIKIESANAPVIFTEYIL